MYPSSYIASVEAVLKALGDPTRRTMLEALRQGSATAGELADLVSVARPGVSRHLRVLREADLVEVRAVGQHRIYSLKPEPLVEVNQWLTQYLADWNQRFDALHTEIARGQRARRRP